MMNFSTLKRFVTEQDGNAVIDWAVLMAGMVMMAIAVVLTVTDPVETITDETIERIEDVGEGISTT